MEDIENRLFMTVHSERKRGKEAVDLIYKKDNYIQIQRREKKNHRESSRALEQVDQRVCGVSVLNDVQNLSGGDPEQPLVSLLCFE